MGGRTDTARILQIRPRLWFSKNKNQIFLFLSENHDENVIIIFPVDYKNFYFFTLVLKIPTEFIYFRDRAENDSRNIIFNSFLYIYINISKNTGGGRQRQRGTFFSPTLVCRARGVDDTRFLLIG